MRTRERQGEVKISTDKMVAINQLYMGNPSLQAARAILQGQLLSSGIRLMRKGEDVELAEPLPITSSACGSRLPRT